MRILALNTYHGGSHQAFLDGWINHSRHEFDVLTLPAYKWKWRMRHAPVTFADRLSQSPLHDRDWDALFCTDMLNLAEFRGLCRHGLQTVPMVVYFHENQLTYPNRESVDRDLHFAFTNITTALAADAVWFNSAFHRESFLAAVDEWMERMPDYQLHDATARIRDKSAIHSPGIELQPPRPPRRDGPLRLLWVSRWEHDKDPETFFAALTLLQEQSIDFRLTVLGESYGNIPACFAKARTQFADRIDHWGFAAGRAEYVRRLREADVVVSTARHEFFGIAVMEAVAAGCFPLVPRRLAYPEVLGNQGDFFHDASAEGIVNCLRKLNENLESYATCRPNGESASAIVQPYAWPVAAARMDRSMEAL